MKTLIILFVYISMCHAQWNDPKKEFFWIETGIGEYKHSDIRGSIFDLSYNHIDEKNYWRLGFQVQTTGYLYNSKGTFLELNSQLTFQIGEYHFLKRGMVNYSVGIAYNWFDEKISYNHDSGHLQFVSVPFRIQYNHPGFRSLFMGISLGGELSSHRNLYMVGIAISYGNVNKITE